jgi:hypothetical protein
MSRAASPFTGRFYGVVRVTREWEMARSSFYYQREIAAQPGRVLGRRGPKTVWSDGQAEHYIRSGRPRRPSAAPCLLRASGTRFPFVSAPPIVDSR